MDDEIKIEKITGFAGAVFNEANKTKQDPLHRLFEPDKQRMFESAEDFVWIKNEAE